MIHRFPPELRYVILRKCDFLSLLQLRQTSWLYKLLAEDELSQRRRLHIAGDFLDPYCCSGEQGCSDTTVLHVHKLVKFVRFYMPELRELSFRHSPVALSLADLIQMAAAAPQLTSLDLSQLLGKTVLERDAVYALPYFRHLKCLRMDGFVSRRTPARGCAHRPEIPPIRQLLELEVLEMECEQDTLSRILHSMRESHCILHKLRRVNFGVRHCSAVYPELLIWFLRAHLTLCSVRIHNALFATSEQLRRFFNALLVLPYLEELQLDGCTSCDRIDAAMQTQFLNAISAKGVAHCGTVRSMRFDPDHNH